MHPADCLIKVAIRVHPFALTLYADTAPDNVARLTRIGGRLEAEIGNPPLFKVVGVGEKHRRLGRTHGAVTEI